MGPPAPMPDRQWSKHVVSGIFLLGQCLPSTLLGRGKSLVLEPYLKVKNSVRGGKVISNVSLRALLPAHCSYVLGLK